MHKLRNARTLIFPLVHTHYDSVFNYTTAHYFSTEYLLPSVHRMSTAVWEFIQCFVFFLLFLITLLRPCNEGGITDSFIILFCFLDHLHHSICSHCFMNTLCSGHVWSQMLCWPHSLLEIQEHWVSALDKQPYQVFLISLSPLAIILTLNTSPKIFLLFCLVLVLDMPESILPCKLLSHCMFIKDLCLSCHLNVAKITGSRAETGSLISFHLDLDLDSPGWQL